MQPLRVTLGDRSYPIHIGAGLLNDEKLYAPHVGARSVAVITNRVVAPLYLASLQAFARDRTLAACLENGLIALASGVNAVRFRPPLNLSREEAEEGVRKLRRAIAAAIA